MDAMYVKFQDGAFVSNKDSEDGIILDIEILEASQKLKPKGPFAF